MRIAASILFCATAMLASAQEEHDVPGPTNTLFLEGLGQAIYWSANFEHTEYAGERWGFHMRAGVGLWSTKKTSAFFGLPLTFSLSYGDIHRAEVGAGFLYYSYGNVGANAARTTGTLFPTFHAGYRLQKEYGGLFLRAGVMVTEIGDAPGFDAEPGTWGFNPYLCIGNTF